MDYEFSLEVLQQSLALAQASGDPLLTGMIDEISKHISDTVREMTKSKISRDAMRAIKARYEENS